MVNKWQKHRVYPLHHPSVECLAGSLDVAFTSVVPSGWFNLDGISAAAVESTFVMAAVGSAAAAPPAPVPTAREGVATGMCMSFGGTSAVQEGRMVRETRGEQAERDTNLWER